MPENVEFLKNFLDIDWSKVKNVEPVSKEELADLSSWIDGTLNSGE